MEEKEKEKMEEVEIILDRQFRLPLISPVCCRCKHLRSAVFHSCDAFPGDGEPEEDLYGIPGGRFPIPDDIWEGKDDHTKPREGDHGIRFEPIED